MNDQRTTPKPFEDADREPRFPDAGGDALGAALRALPPERAGAGFTGRVLARLDEREVAGGAADVWETGTAGGTGGRHRTGRFARPPVRLRRAAWATLAAAGLATVLGLALSPQLDLRSGAPERIADTEVAPPTEPGGAAGEAREPGSSGEPAAASDRVDRRGGADSAIPAGTDRVRGGEPAIPAGSERLEGAGPPTGDSSSSRRAEPSRAAAPESPPRLAAASPADDPRAALARVRAELDALRRDYRRFEVGLAELPEIGRHGQPVVYLGGDEGLGLVLDLGRDLVPAASPGDGGERPHGSSL